MKKPLHAIPLGRTQKAHVAGLLRVYLQENFELDIGGLQAGIFTDYLSEHVGKFYYNQAINDTIAHMSERVEDLYALIKPEDEVRGD